MSVAELLVPKYPSELGRYSLFHRLKKLDELGDRRADDIDLILFRH